MTPWADVVVVGGGIVGAAVAAAVAKDRRTLLLARPPAGGEATEASAGMLAAQIEARADEPLLALHLAGREAHERLRRALPVDVAHGVGYRRTGILRLALDAAARAELVAQTAAQHNIGLAARWLEPHELRARHAGIAPRVQGALEAPDDGVVNAPALAAALRALAFARGAQVVTAEATALLSRHGAVTGVRSGAGSWRTRCAVLAAGAWSAQLPGLPRRLPVGPVRGQMLAVPAPAGWGGQVLFGPRSYLVPREDHALLGSTMEHAGFDARTTPDGLAAVREACAEFFPALAEAPALAAWAGLRPVTPDGLPILGRDPDLAGLLYATGHGRNGILLGPLTGELVRDLILSGETPLDLAAYRVERFATGVEGGTAPSRR